MREPQEESMTKNSDATTPCSALGRREFLKFGAGGAAMAAALPAALPTALAAEPKEAKSKGVDWWDARPGKEGVGFPTE